MSGTLWAMAGVIFALACVASLAWDFYQKREYEAWKRQQTVVRGPAGDAVILPEHAEHGVTPDGPAYNPPPPGAERAQERPAEDARPGWTLPAWLRRKPAGERVFTAQIGGWPKLWRLSGEPRPALLLTARYASPDTLKQARIWALLLGFLAGFWLTDTLAKPVDYGWWQVNWLAVVFGAACWWIAFMVLRPLLRLLLWRIATPLRMTFTAGAIEWEGEAQRRSWWPFGKRAEKVFAGEARQPRVVAPHRKAGDEMRKAQERVRKRRKEGALYYQQCSEVLIDAGPNHANWLPVAEIAFDEHGEKALKLVAAIMLADGAAQGTAPEPATTAGAAAAPLRKRRGLLG